MASNSKSFFDSFSGKIGNVVVYTMNGKTVIRALPSIRKRKPTEKQLENRNVFTYVLKLMQKIKPIVKIGFSHTAHNRTAFQEAMSVNLNAYKNAEEKENLGSWLQISAGNRSGFANLSLHQSNDGIEIRWTYNTVEEPLLKNDSVIAFAIEHQSTKVYSTIGEARRCDSNCNIKIPKLETELTYNIFIFAIASLPTARQNPDMVSDSQWVGTVSV